VPPPTPDPEPTNFALRNFNEAVASLKVLSAKPLTIFDHTPFSADDLICQRMNSLRLLLSVLPRRRR
jgi:hypothetical protein